MTVSKTLSNWYKQSKRELPWRYTKLPYKIWLSEIILQQTRVEQGLNYYLKFVDSYPDIKNLADAPLDEVLKIWQGLGYYTRARNLHKTAKKISYELDGRFPDTYRELIQLKGIGPYTAAAIASICFNEPVAVVDGNVYRFLARYFGIDTPVDTAEGRKIFRELAESILDRKEPGNHNEAMMEFGALQCTPVKPDCTHCPLQNSCSAFNKNLITQLPVKKVKIPVKNRYFNYLVINHGNRIFFKQRSGNDIWKMLYEFPLIETKLPKRESEIINSECWKKIFGNSINIKIVDISKEFRHLLTHQRIFARFYRIEVEKPSAYIASNFQAINIYNIKSYAIPRLIEKYLDGIKQSF